MCEFQQLWNFKQHCLLGSLPNPIYSKNMELSGFIFFILISLPQTGLFQSVTNLEGLLQEERNYFDTYMT